MADDPVLPVPSPSPITKVVANPVLPKSDPRYYHKGRKNLELQQARMRANHGEDGRKDRKHNVESLTPQSLEHWLEDQIVQTKEEAAEKLKVPKLSIREAVKMFLQEREDGSLRLHTLLNRIFRTAINEKSPFQIAAAKVLLEQGFGRPSASPDEDGHGKGKGGLTVVYVERPKFDPDIPLLTDDPRSPRALRAPEFVDAEVLDD